MKIAVLSGGTDGERPVSLKSGAFVYKTLQGMDHEVENYILPDEIDTFFEKYKEFDLVFPMFHGAYGEDGTIFGMLKTLGVPYTHSDPDAHALCFNKQATKHLAEDLGVQVAPSQVIYRADQHDENIVPFPVVLKPNAGGSSIATYVNLKNTQELKDAFENGQNEVGNNTAFIVEGYLEGEEYSVPLIGEGSHVEILPIMQVVLEGAEFFDYELKYEDKGGMETFPEDMDSELRERLESLSKNLYQYFNLKTLSRIDFIVKNGVPYLLEINTVPGFTEVSIIPRAWRNVGRSNEELIQKMIELSS